MLRSGQEYLASLRDGRRVYIGGELVPDVTTHPAFAKAAQMYASLYDLKRHPVYRDVLSFEEDGTRYTRFFQRPRSIQDLTMRSQAHKAWADVTYGLLGRSPDHVASFITGLIIQPEVLGRHGRAFADNLVAYHRYLQQHDLFSSCAMQPPLQFKHRTAMEATGHTAMLQVTRTDDHGVILNGMKMMATAGVYCNEIWVGNTEILPQTLAAEAVTCAVPVNTPGVSLWSRKPFGALADPFEAPLSSRFDESDVTVVFQDVKVPWERVFVHDQAAHSREIYICTASHAFGNHQSNVRFLAKLQFIVGLAARIVEASNLAKIPAVHDTLGRLAAMEGALAAMIAGQLHAYEQLPNGYVNFNRRYMYATQSWCQEHYAELVRAVRELCGAGVFQMPADTSVLRNPETAGIFEYYWKTGRHTAQNLLLLHRTAWDLLGSEFGGRQQQYEAFYAGASYVLHNHNHRECPWDQFKEKVDSLMAETLKALPNEAILRQE